MLVVVLITMDEGGCVTKVTDMGGGGAVAVIVMIAVANLVLSVTDVAVIVTVAGVGTVLGDV